MPNCPAARLAFVLTSSGAIQSVGWPGASLAPNSVHTLVAKKYPIYGSLSFPLAFSSRVASG